LKKILIIQTAFIGDVILATSLIETLHKHAIQPCLIDILVRKGNESLLVNHPFVNEVIVWNKKEKKYKNLFSVIKKLRKINYANVYNLQRYASTGFITWFIKADLKSGYSSNTISFAYDRKIKHDLESGKHEVERNFELIDEEIESNCKHPLKPKLYPSEEDKLVVSNLTQHFGDFVVMAPASVWFTKQLPLKKWVEIIQNQSANVKTCLIGAPSDEHLINQIINDAGTENCVNLAGKLSLLQSAALIGRAKRTFVNDSAPLHLASAMNAPVIAFFCSTVPAFGFGPLSDDSKIAEVEEKLSCRPCGLHGYKACPKGHFDCGAKIALPFN